MQKKMTDYDYSLYNLWDLQVAGSWSSFYPDFWITPRWRNNTFIILFKHPGTFENQLKSSISGYERVHLACFLLHHSCCVY